MKFRILSILIATMFFSCLLKAQSKFWDKITVRRAFETKTDADTKPAIFSFTSPKDTTTSFLFNGGVGFDLFYLKSDSLKHSFENAVSGFFVYNRNTLINKKQKNFKIGLSGGPVFDIRPMPSFSIFGPATVQYLHDHIDTTQSLIITNYWYFILVKDGLPAIGAYRSADSWTAFNIIPHIGWEYQNTFEASSKVKKGNDVRFYFNGEVNLMVKKRARYTEKEMKSDFTDSLQGNAAFSKRPVKDLKPIVDSLYAAKGNEKRRMSEWPPLIEFSVSYTGRSAFVHRNLNFEKYIPLFTAGIKIYPINNKNFSFGLSYNNGANPIDATPKQTFWLFSITFKK